MFMKRWLTIFILIFLAGCSGKNNEPEIYFTGEKASKYFQKIDSICLRDNGSLWGVNLSGPIIFVDRPTRRLFANSPDNEGILRLRDGVYQGYFPRERIIENSAVEFGGALYAMTPLPPEEDEYRIITAAINSLFHSYQKKIGIKPQKFIIHEMDEKFARIWLKLEFRALRKALESDGLQRDQYLRDALIFRGARREQFSSTAKEENLFEIYEGLSLFTSTMLCNRSEEEIKQKLIEGLDFFYRFQSFSRSFGFILGSTYSFLLHTNGYNLRKIVDSDTVDLGMEVMRHFNLQVPEVYRDVAGSLAIVYEVETIYKEEEQRMNEIRERIRRQLSKFTEKSVLSIELESPYFDFEPEDIRSLDTLGTIYNSIRIADNWGKLTVDKNGCLISYNLKHLRLPARNIKEIKNHYYGDGWHIILNNNWKIMKEGDNYFLRRVMLP